MGTSRVVYRALFGNMRKIEHLENLSIDGKVMLRRIYKNLVGGHGLE